MAIIKGTLMARAWVDVQAPLTKRYIYYSEDRPYDCSTIEGYRLYIQDWREMQDRIFLTTCALDFTPDVSPDYKALRSNNGRGPVAVPEGQDPVPYFYDDAELAHAPPTLGVPNG